jgi:hypothetical protein
LQVRGHEQAGVLRDVAPGAVATELTTSVDRGPRRSLSERSRSARPSESCCSCCPTP